MSMSQQLKKTVLVTSLLVLIGFFAYYAYTLQTREAWADSDDPSFTPLRGWAWSDTIGWLSFNHRDNPTSTPEYLVTVTGVEAPAGFFKLQGHAWSDNVGWLSFNTDQYGTDCPAPRPCGDCGACYGQATNRIVGWAKMLSLKNPGDPENLNYGWLELGENGNNSGVAATASNGDINQSNWGDLTGWAWNGSDDKSGLGWLSFNCLNGGAGGTDICASANYKVSARPDQPVITSIMPTPGKDSSSIDINWTPVYGATDYAILRQDYVCSGNPTQRCTKDFDNTCPGMGSCNQLTAIITIDTVAGRSSASYSDTNNIVEFATYLYRVRAINLFAGIASLSTPKYSVSPIGMNDLAASGICQAPPAGANGQIFVDLSWNAYYTFNAGQIEAYDIEYCSTQTGGSCGDLNFSALPPISTPSSTNPAKWRHVIVDDTGNATDLYSRLKASEFITYRIRGVGRDKVCIGGANINHPCADNSACPGSTCSLTNTCQGGDNDGNACTDNADCPQATCGPSKSSWLLTAAKQICPRGTEYKEVRPDN